jgi:putative sigma-54 modulation protein
VLENHARGLQRGFPLSCEQLVNWEERSDNVLVTVSSRHMDVTPALKTYAETKAGKLNKYYDRIQEIEVILDNGKDQTRVEMIVNAEHKNTFIAHHDDPDAYAGIDGCVHKLERQLSEHKKKFRNRKHPDEITPKRGGSEG